MNAYDRREFLKTLSAGMGLAWMGAHTSLAGAGLRAVGRGDEFDLARWLQPVPDDAVFSEEGYYVWCGTMARDEQGICHLYYSRWPKEEGFAAWVTRSEVAHAVADNPLGPYRHVGVVLPARGSDFWDGHATHNPTIARIGKKYYLYYMGNRGDRVNTGLKLNWTHRNNQRIGVAVADSAGGPWRRLDKPVIDVTPGFHDSLMCSNPAVTEMADGRVLMVYKGVGERRPRPAGGPVVHLVATADNPEGPFTKHPDPVFTSKGVDFPAEDPFIWREGSRYWSVVKDMNGYFANAGRSLVLMQSDNGIDWRPATHALVCGTEYRRTDGSLRKLYALERPQLYMENSEPRVLFCAGRVQSGSPCDTFNVAIPLARPS